MYFSLTRDSYFLLTKYLAKKRKATASAVKPAANDKVPEPSNAVLPAKYPGRLYRGAQRRPETRSTRMKVLTFIPREPAVMGIKGLTGPINRPKNTPGTP